MNGFIQSDWKWLSVEKHLNKLQFQPHRQQKKRYVNGDDSKSSIDCGEDVSKSLNCLLLVMTLCYGFWEDLL